MPPSVGRLVPRRRPIQDAALSLLRRLKLIGPVFRLWERWQTLLSERTRRRQPEVSPDGLPVPPQRLIVLVAGPASVESFVNKGRIGADTVRDALARNGADIAQVDDILDFGVGCGRIARHWHDLGTPRIHGCDLHPELVEWTSQNLPFVDVSQTDVAPPLPYADGSFDVIYAFSVFTHLPEDLCAGWAKELHRVLRPSGHLIFSTHGEAYFDRLSEEERAAYTAGQIVVQFEELAGANLCSAFHPPDYVRHTLGAEYDVLEHTPSGAPSNGKQDLWVLRRP